MAYNGVDLVKAAPIVNMVQRKCRTHGVSFGLTECGYDIRIRERVVLHAFRPFVLASSIELFNMPDFLMGRVLNKSTWARLGVDASMTTNIEPGWKGFLTLELRYARWRPLVIPAGAGIAQIIFEEVRNPVRYSGRYQNQPPHPVKAIMME